MRIVLHGATDCGSSNFGDFIYAEQIYRHIRKITDNAEVSFYNPSDFFMRYIEGCKSSNKSVKGADLAIYIPGGYFGEGHNARIRDNVFQFARFMPFGLEALARKVQIAVIGLGAGPLNSTIMKRSVKRIVCGSALVTVRDQESADALRSIGCSSPVEAGDMILAMNLDAFRKESERILELRRYAAGRKILLVHYNHSVLAKDIFAEAVCQWKGAHPDYCIVVCADQILANEEELFQSFVQMCPEAYHFTYEDPYELLSLIREVDTILTCKLHVGVVGAMFNKSVLCAAEHPGKTRRFYKQIGQDERFFDLFTSNPSLICAGLETFSGKGISIPAKETARAAAHWTMLDQVLMGTGDDGRR